MVITLFCNIKYSLYFRFGDLVTGDYWGTEFLHESFANFFEHRAYQAQLSDKKDKDLMETTFVLSREDGLLSAIYGDHAVVADKSHFDGITYNAGGAILRMLEAALGSSTFYKALNVYLTRNAYKTADHNTLIEAFESVGSHYFLLRHYTNKQIDLRP
jgi:aminopeptidase N